MPSIFNSDDVNQILSRINLLHASSPPIWGKMNVGQMLVHSQKSFDVLSGELKLKRSFMGFLFGGMAKRKMVADKEFSKSLPTAPEFIIKGEQDVEAEKQRLISKIQAFSKSDQQKLAEVVHPFFGKMTINEWDTLTWKHLDHHLRQFGV